MKRLLPLLLAMMAALFAGPAPAQTRAEFGVATGASPNCVEVRAKDGTWVCMGLVDQTAHSFAPSLQLGQVTNYLLAPLPAQTLLGNATGASASGAYLTVAEVKALLAYVPGDIAGFNATAAAAAPVQSVAGRTGTVTLGVGDVAGAAPLNSPAFTGTVTSATPLGVASGGNGTATPTISAGPGITVAGTWGAETISATGATGVATTPSQSGLTIVASGTNVTVTAKYMVVVNASGTGLYIAAPSVSCATGTTGANGMDTGSITASTWYAVYTINNGTTTACLLSASFTAPTLPLGYTYKMRDGAIFTNASSLILASIQIGNWGKFTATPLPAMASTTAAVGSVTVPTWVAVPIIAPPTAASVQMMVLSGAGYITILAPNNTYGRYTSTANPPLIYYDYDVPVSRILSIIPESSNIYWAAQANASIFAVGWVDNI